MPLPNPNQDRPDAVSFKQDEITFANRAPNSKDKGRFWVYATATSAVLYVRSHISGSWYAQA